MAAVFWMSRLKRGVAATDYEIWVRDFDYAKARELPSIRSYRVYRIQDSFQGAEPPPFDYLEAIEVTDLEAYRRELAEHAAAQAIAQEWGNFVELVHSLNGELIPPGISADE